MTVVTDIGRLIGIVTIVLVLINLALTVDRGFLHRPRVRAATELLLGPVFLAVGGWNVSAGYSWLGFFLGCLGSVQVAFAPRYASRCGLICRLRSHFWIWTLLDGSELMLGRGCPHPEHVEALEAEALAHVTAAGAPPVGAECARCHVTR